MLRSVRTLYRNGRIYPGAATALVTDGGRIAWIGTDPPGPVDQSVDLDGALVAPAFVDAHVHATATGLTLTGLDLSTASSLRAALDAVERHSRSVRGRPVLGHGWDDTRWPEHRPPTATELDRAGYGGAVYLSRVDAHSAVVSSALLTVGASLSGFREDGWLIGDAHHAVRRVVFGSLTPGQIRDAQRATRRRAAALGIACLHEMAGPETSSADDLAGLLALAATESGPEVIGYWGELFGIDAARDLGAAGAAGDLYCDGSLGSHTAALTAPYADAANTSGEQYLAAEDIAEHIRRCAAAGLQAGFHAIGDAAVDAILDAVDRLGPGSGTGHRVEHAEMVRAPARLAASGLTASMQPAFDAAWGGPDAMYAERLGARRAAGLNQFASLAEAGVPLAFGSDAPVTRIDPWGAVRAAAHPRTPASAITPEAAFAAHTRGGWAAARRTGEGVLAPGAAATFAIWQVGEMRDGLPDLAPGAELPNCARTVLRGQTIHPL